MLHEQVAAFRVSFSSAPRLPLLLVPRPRSCGRSDSRQNSVVALHPLQILQLSVLFPLFHLVFVLPYRQSSLFGLDAHTNRGIVVVPVVSTYGLGRLIDEPLEILVHENVDPFVDRTSAELLEDGDRWHLVGNLLGFSFLAAAETQTQKNTIGHGTTTTSHGRAAKGKRIRGTENGGGCGRQRQGGVVMVCGRLPFQFGTDVVFWSLVQNHMSQRSTFDGSTFGGFGGDRRSRSLMTVRISVKDLKDCNVTIWHKIIFEETKSWMSQRSTSDGSTFWGVRRGPGSRSLMTVRISVKDLKDCNVTIWHKIIFEKIKSWERPVRLSRRSPFQSKRRVSH